jgi:hypothetical protein
MILKNTLNIYLLLVDSGAGMQVLTAIAAVEFIACVAMKEMYEGSFYYFFVDSLIPLAGLHFCVGLDFVAPSL